MNIVQKKRCLSRNYFIEYAVEGGNWGLSENGFVRKVLLYRV